LPHLVWFMNKSQVNGGPSAARDEKYHEVELYVPIWIRSVIDRGVLHIYA
jgi:hypothetical protein